jgi:hypothetical protein
MRYWPTEPVIGLVGLQFHQQQELHGRRAARTKKIPIFREELHGSRIFSIHVDLDGFKLD